MSDNLSDNLIIVPEPVINRFKPMNNRIVVRRKDDSSGITSGGIIIPDAAKEKSLIGEVAAVHADSKVEVGDQVMFGKYSGSEVTIGNEEFLIMAETELLGVLEQVKIYY